MAALTAERSVSRKGAESTATVPTVTVLVKASTTIFKGALVCIDATGFAIPAATTPATLITIGVATKTVVAAASGSFPLDVTRGLYPFNNNGGDLVVQADMGKKVYILDDNTVMHTAGTSPVAGVFLGFDENNQPLVQVGNLSSTGV
jgi:hypothetical protein